MGGPDIPTAIIQHSTQWPLSAAGLAVIILKVMRKQEVPEAAAAAVAVRILERQGHLLRAMPAVQAMWVVKTAAAAAAREAPVSMAYLTPAAAPVE